MKTRRNRASGFICPLHQCPCDQECSWAEKANCEYYQGLADAECGAEDGGKLPAFERPFVIVDPDGRLFRDYTASVPQTAHSFTPQWERAMRFPSAAAARKEKSKLFNRLRDAEGARKVPRGYLRIAKAAFETVA